ncbi:hypothetical protein JL722_3818 [Aureococcus anophagefferens]|nr:hypothetical protein JL722_3818 [Aureococcus anophagefferens]
MSLFFDWYNWPAVTADAYNYAESDEGFDLYHCHSCGYLVSSCAYCWDEDLRSDGCAHTPRCEASGDDLYMTVYGMNSHVSTAMVKLSRVVMYDYIRESELEAIKTLWLATCEPVLAPPAARNVGSVPANWSWVEYAVTDLPEVQGEADVRSKPYCDWWTDMTREGLDGVTTGDCLAIPGVVCDVDGYVTDT